MRKVKIVGTLGPSTEGVERLVEIIRAGLDAARLNFSHGDHESHMRMHRDLRAAEKKAGKPVAVIGDLCGPKLRIGRVKSGACELVEGGRVVLTARDVLGVAELLPHSYKALAEDVRTGDPVLINDGLIRLEVVSMKGGEVECSVKVGGTVSDHKGMNLPGTKISAPALSEKDRADIEFAKELGVDYLALSFVRSPEDIIEAKRLAPDTPVIAKIEKPEAIENLSAILDAADGAMVARGDLGVELGHEKVPLMQKRIISEMRPRAKPSITATQMLESMVHNPCPTRAEVSDVANAVIDGTDAVMLSAETSVGRYPVEAVKTMSRIIHEIENGSGDYRHPVNPVMKDRSFSSMIAEAVTAAARNFDLSAVAVYTRSGRSAALVSAERPHANLIAFSWKEKVVRRLALHWGVKPLFGQWIDGVSEIVEQAERQLLAHDFVLPGDDIAVTFGVQIAEETFQTNIMKLWKVRDLGGVNR